jgi:hypothetical protein
MFPEHIEAVFEQFGVPADTKAALYDLYVSMGEEVLAVFGDIAEGVASPTALRPEDTVTIREKVVERYVRRNHPLWIAGKPTASLWHPRELEGRASGLAMPLRAVTAPEGVLLLGRNAHYGGRQETISFDIVAADVEDAVAIGTAVGQQHTLPGSVGETSGTYDSIRGVALIWEIQPNVYKPAGDRNRAINKVYRRHRDWHRLTLTAALEWLRERGVAIYILRGEALAATHEVNPQKPVSQTIVDHHNRTVEEVAAALGSILRPPTDDEEFLLLESMVMNHALRKHVLREGASSSMMKVEV